MTNANYPLDNYYTAVIMLSLMTLGVLCILVRENGRIRSEHKRYFYLTYVLIAGAALCEWAAVQLDGMENISSVPITIVKCLDYILTPMTGWAIVEQMRLKNRWHTALRIVVAFNVLIQIVCCPFGLMVAVDENNRYSHGRLYWLYVVIYIIILLLIIIEFVIYGKTFRRQNRLSLYSTMFIVVAGILIQEVMGREYRTAYLGMTIGSALLFIRYAEYSLMAADDQLHEQHLQITTDTLTGLKSRFAYSAALVKLDKEPQLPENLVVFSIDINGLKRENDTFGHSAGDDLIQAAATVIKNTFGATGECYRTGGDEFVVLSRLEPSEAEEALAELALAAKQWHSKTVKSLSLSAGYAHASEHEGVTLEKLVAAADMEMYKAKNAYYRKYKKKRRR